MWMPQAPAGLFRHLQVLSGTNTPTTTSEGDGGGYSVLIHKKQPSGSVCFIQFLAICSNYIDDLQDSQRNALAILEWSVFAALQRLNLEWLSEPNSPLDSVGLVIRELYVTW